MDEKVRDNLTNDEALFQALNQQKKKKRRKRWLTALIIVAVIVLALVIAVSRLRAKVEAAVATEAEDVLTYTAAYGSISTQVTGTGTIEDVDPEEITVPYGVEIDEVVLPANTKVEEGDVIATLDMTSVLSTMASVQDDIASLDKELSSSTSDAVSTYVTAGAKGRVKKVYAAPETDVSACMVENGALALISLDGYMAVEIPAGSLAAGSSVTVQRADGTSLPGKVDSILKDTATVLVTDNGPELDEEVTVLDEAGTELGSGALQIHNCFRVTGFAGTVSRVSVKENQTVYAGSAICTLTNTSYSANYNRILKERSEKEETLLELLNLYHGGALRAPFSGTILTVDYEKEDSADTSSAASALASGTSASTEDPLIVTISRDEEMRVTFSVDETDILSLELDQPAELEIASLGDQVYRGTITDIDKTATSASGVTAYSATVTFEKTPYMLSGMSADITVNIQGSDNVLIVPADAVNKTSAFSFVYLSYDEESGMFGDMRPVEVGISNDNYVEITSGLEAGDVVYYTEKETNPFFMMGGAPGGMGSMGGMSGAPSGMGGGPGGSGRPDGSNRPGGGSRP